MLHVPKQSVIKTLVMQDEQKRPLLVLMHGDCEVSTKQLVRIDPHDFKNILNVRRVTVAIRP